MAREMRSDQLVRRWLTEDTLKEPPFGIGADTLFVAYYASAELGCFLALGWPFPARILDLYAEFRCRTNGLPLPHGNGLLGALAYHGLDSIGTVEKDEMRELAMRPGTHTTEEQKLLLDYCQTDVDALAQLLPRMLPEIDLPRALLRGRNMAAAARMEWHGVPIDTRTLDRLRQHWSQLKQRLIGEVDKDYGVFVPVHRRTLNPESAFGAAVLETALAWDLDPYQLADAAEAVWAEEKAAASDSREALQAARKATGLTPSRIARWEDSGRDFSLFPGLDEQARDLAGTYPELGIGHGYDPEAPDEDDHAGRLWDRLRRTDEKPKSRYHPDIIRRAAEELEPRAGEPPAYCGPMAFSDNLFAEYLQRKGICWPRLESGALAKDDTTFKEMAKLYPGEIGPIRELRHILSQLRLNELAVGSDGRNRCLLSTFRSRTGRNQPSNTAFIFGPSAWLRSLIQPGPGCAVAYVDWSAQELAIAAALSGDTAMQDAYTSGDPYIYLAKRAGAVPKDATKKTHSKEREQFKVVSLGVLYGLSAIGIARKLNVSPCHGQELLHMHQAIFRRFWEWSEQIEMRGMLTGRLRTVFGWQVQVPSGVDPKTGQPLANPRSLRNFPMQAHGAEMLRLACCLATEQDIRVCAPIHDALLVESSTDDIEAVVAETQAVMRKAGKVVLDGFPLRTDAKIVRHPDRYQDERGVRMWDLIGGLLRDLEGDSEGITGDTLGGVLPLSPATP